MQPQDIATITRVAVIVFFLGVVALVIGHPLTLIPLGLYTLYVSFF